MIVEFTRKTEVKPGKYWSKGQRVVFDREVGEPYVRSGAAIEVDAIEKSIVIKQANKKATKNN